VASEQGEIAVLLSMGGEMAGEVLSGALNRHAGLRVVSRVTSASEVLDAVERVHVDVAIISATMGDAEMNGISTVRELRKRVPHVKVIVLFDVPDRQGVVESFRAGARGVFDPGSSSFDHLCRCVIQVHAGQIWARCDELRDVMNEFSRQTTMKVVDASGMPLLTKREEDVVRLLAEGYTNREIARALHLSTHTVKNYLFRMFEKLGISSRVELVLYALSAMQRGESGNAVRNASVDKQNRKAS